MGKPSKRKVHLQKARMNIKSGKWKQSRINKAAHQRKRETKNKRKHIEKALHMIKDMFSLGSLDLPCDHYRVGSTSFDLLMSGRYNISNAHRHLKGNEYSINNQVGALGEALSSSRKSHADVYEPQPFSIHPRLPFICAKSDYMVNSRYLIEVKTTASQKTCDTYKNTVPLQVAVQIWIALECFELEKAILEVYFIKDHPTKNKDGTIQIGHLEGTYKYEVVKECSLFDETNIPQIVDRYVNFLQQYFISIKRSLTNEPIEEIKEFFLNFAKNKHTVVRNSKHVPMKEICAKIASTLINSNPKKTEERNTEDQSGKFHQFGYETISHPRFDKRTKFILNESLRNKIFKNYLTSYNKYIGEHTENEVENSDCMFLEEDVWISSEEE
jgi:hypothetical protein